jgi:hypothetical protein
LCFHCAATGLAVAAAVCCCSSAVVPLRLKKKPFDGGEKNFFRRGYNDLRMHEEGYRAY